MSKETPPIRRFLLVANPASGRGRAARVAAQAAASLRARGFSAEVAFTDASGHAARLAAGAAGRFDAIVAVGGDGTLNEVARGLILESGKTSAERPVVGILSCGTGNCAARAFHIPRAFTGALDVLVGGKTRKADAGVLERGGKPEGVFLLWLGAGLDGAVIHSVAARRRGALASGMLHYALPILRAWARYPFPAVRVEADGNLLVGDARGVAVANVGLTAAFLNIAPEADPADGALNLLAVREPRRLAHAWLAFRAAQGRLAQARNVSTALIREAALSSAEKVPVHVDGEAAGFLPVTAKVVPCAWKMLVP